MLFDLIVIGAGPAAAYYLNVLDPAKIRDKDNPVISILVISKENAWQRLRAQDVNHKVYEVEQLGGAPDYKSGMQGGQALAENNFATIKSATKAICGKEAKIVDGEVTKIERKAYPDNGFPAYAIICKPSEPNSSGSEKKDGLYWAKKVVVATGAGIADDDFHKTPKGITQAIAEKKDGQTPVINEDGQGRLMNMDKFNRWLAGAKEAGMMPMPNNPTEQTVIIMGPNAANDAIESARKKGFKVIWLSGRAPQSLSTGHQLHVEELKKDAILYEYKLNPQPKWDSNRKKFTMTLTKPRRFVSQDTKEGERPPVPTDVTADYIVWGPGQEPKRAAPFLRELMRGENADKKLVDGMNVEPIYDVNCRAGSSPYEHVLGFQLKDPISNGGVELIGAVCRQLVMMDEENGNKPHLEIKHTFQQSLSVECAKHRTALQTRYSELWELAKAKCSRLAEKFETLEDFFTKLYANKDNAARLQEYDTLEAQVKAYEREVRARFQKQLETKNGGAYCREKAEIAACNYAELFLQCARVAKSEAYEYVCRNPFVLAEDLEKAPKAILTSNIFSSQQLGGIRATTAMQAGYIPPSVGKQEWDETGQKKNLELKNQGRTKDMKWLEVKNVGQPAVEVSSADQQMLRVYIAVNYPFIDYDKEETRTLEDEIHRQIQVFINRRKVGKPWGEEKEFSAEKKAKEFDHFLRTEVFAENTAFTKELARLHKKADFEIHLKARPLNL
jgi:hypothetical protein